MALNVLGQELAGGGLILWVEGARAIFDRIRAGESYTVAGEWDGEAFTLVDPCGARVVFRDGPGGAPADLTVTLETTQGEFEERCEWFARLGFAFADERFESGREQRLMAAEPVLIWVAESDVSSPEAKPR